MPTQLTEYAVEKSTFAVQAAFLDDAGAAVTPDSITWTLCDPDGNIINSRSAVVIAVPAATVTIVLSDADLQLLSANNDWEIRYLEISAVYDSDIGSNLPLKDRAEFKVLNLKSIT